jgi:GDPmannose 4,6-dehydratase
MKTALITGITGQDGAYLSKFLLENDYKILGIIRKGPTSLFRLKYLGIDKNIKFIPCNLLNQQQVMDILKEHQPDEIYNLAAQSSVAQSFENPSETINFNINSVLNILESIKIIDKSIRFYQASSSEMYGKVNSLPITEETPMHPLSPYAVSKSAAHWITINFRESYNLFACCGIMFNHESFLRGEQYFIKKIIRQSLEMKHSRRDSINVGNIDVRRDFGYSPRYVEAMWRMLQQDTPDDYIICSGKSISLREIIIYVFDKLGISLDNLVIDRSLYRPNDILNIYGDNSKAREKLRWDYSVDFIDILDILIEEEERNYFE